MNQHRTIEHRRAKVELRADGKTKTAVGYSIVFPPAVSQDLGGFREYISPDAVKLERNNVFALFAHDAGRILGSTDSGTLKLTKDSKGVRHKITLPNTTDGNDLAELLKRGDGGQCSFGFCAISDRWEERNGVIYRTVTDLELIEISVGVAFPAYTDTTSALRSAPAAIRARLKRSDDPGDADQQQVYCGCDEPVARCIRCDSDAADCEDTDECVLRCSRCLRDIGDDVDNDSRTLHLLMLKRRAE